MSVAIEIFNAIADGRDGTIRLNGEDLPSFGYMVGGAGRVQIFADQVEANHPDALERIATLVEDASAAYVGWWTDSETGKVYVDETSWHVVKAAAFHAALTRGEIAFWDVKEGREIRTAG